MRMGSAESEQILLAILPKVTGFMSMIGSGMIAYDVLFNPKRRRKIYHRIMCGLSISDFVSSFVLVLSTWPIPKDADEVYGNVGNHATCEAIGMIGQTFGITTPFYNFTLCCYYFMVIYRNMPERKIVPHEAWFHVLPITIGLGTGIAGIPLTLYNPAGYICWIAEDPPGCDRDPAITCHRGSLAWLFRWLFFYGWIWVIFLFITTVMFLIYNKVRVQERALNKHRVKGQKKCRKRSRQVANQAMQYVFTYYITFFFGTVTRILQLAQQGKTYFPIKVLFAIFFPLQGVFNAFVYFYSRRGWEGSNISLSAASMASFIAKPFFRSGAGKEGDLTSEQPSQKTAPEIANSEVIRNISDGDCSQRAKPVTKLVVESEINDMFQIPYAEWEQDDSNDIDQSYESP